MSDKPRMKGGFIWSSSIIYLCAILLLCSVSQAGMANLASETTRNRMASDKLQLIAYNLLFDLNLYLYNRVGEEACQIAVSGESPMLLSNITVRDWLSTAKNWLKLEGVYGEIEILHFKLNQHRISGQDAILMNELALPLSDPLYIDAIDIDADMNVTLRDPRTKVTFQTLFKIRSLNPIRIFGLNDIAVKFNKYVRTVAPSWGSYRPLNEMVKDVEIQFRNFARNFFQKISNQSYAGSVSYEIHVKRINAVKRQVIIRLDELNITDMSKYAHIATSSKFTRINYRLQDQEIKWEYSTPLTPEGIEVKITGIYVSPA